MKDCPTCKGNLLIKTPSIIGSPKCNPDCPESIGCEFITFTECVVYNGQELPCIGINNGDTANEILSQLESIICELGNTNSCTSKISSTDECCGYLEDKIVGGNGITIVTETDNLGCSTLVISETCWTWNNISFSTGWRNYNNSYQTVQYSNVKECTVELRGVALCPSYANELSNGLIATLPAGFRPVNRRSYPIVVNSASPSGYFAGFVEIFPTGQIFCRLTTTVGGYKEVKVPLELRFEIN